MHPFKNIPIVINFDKCISLYNHYHNQEKEHFIILYL